MVSSASDPPFARPGEVVAEKFRVEQVLGRGGMGIVVAATHLQLGQRFALKFLIADGATQPDAGARFLREAQAAARLRSEHVGRVTDVGTLPGDVPYMVMEFLEGQDLAQVIEERGMLPIPEATGYVLQACEALAEAHSLGIVHRDLKPSNLFLTRRTDGSPLIKVLDFGIAKCLDDTGLASANLTGTAVAVGSPHYMSPEQIRSARDVDFRTDIWSLGAVLYELLTGKTPFIAKTLSGLLVEISVGPPRALRESRPEVPLELEQLVLGCLEKDPARRPQTMEQLARALTPLAGLSGPRAPFVEPLSPLKATLPEGQAARTSAGLSSSLALGSADVGWGSTRKPRDLRRRKGWWFGGVAALAVTCVGAALLFRVEGGSLRHAAPLPGSGSAAVSGPVASSPSPQAATALPAANSQQQQPGSTTPAASMLPHPAGPAASREPPAGAASGATSATETGRPVPVPLPSASAKLGDRRPRPNPKPAALPIPKLPQEPPDDPLDNRR